MSKSKEKRKYKRNLLISPNNQKVRDMDPQEFWDDFMAVLNCKGVKKAQLIRDKILFNSTSPGYIKQNSISPVLYNRLSQALGGDLYELMLKVKAGESLPPYVPIRERIAERTVGTGNSLRLEEQVISPSLVLNESAEERMAKRDGFELCLRLWKQEASWKRVEEIREQLKV